MTETIEITCEVEKLGLNLYGQPVYIIKSQTVEYIDDTGKC